MMMLAGLLCSAVVPAFAADFPSKPVTLVVPFAPGGPTDAMARTLAAALRGPLGQTVIVENKAGAGGNLGAEAVARAEADGHTLLFGTSGPLAINASLYKKLGYDPVKSFAPVFQLGHLPNVLVVHPSVPAKNIKELIAYAKANPGKLSFASSGNGASSHLAGVLFNQLAGTDLAHIPYKGTGPALNDLLGGQVAMTFTDVLTALPHVKAGKLRALGVTTLARSQALPEVPTVAEQGVAGFDVSVFFGIVAPAATPKEVVAKLNKAFTEVLKQAEVRQSLQAQGLEFAANTSAEALGGFIRSEMGKWQVVVKSSGAQID
ncbi:MAG TPA: tripartite tricarboxylate transporter substrate binding protein [Roseateles sp.]|nr:tripartite tricarboxylate transporter substrate binding protein [Roseateles sp.]